MTYRATVVEQIIDEFYFEESDVEDGERLEDAVMRIHSYTPRDALEIDVVDLWVE